MALFVKQLVERNINAPCHINNMWTCLACKRLIKKVDSLCDLFLAYSTVCDQTATRLTEAVSTREGNCLLSIPANSAGHPLFNVFSGCLIYRSSLGGGYNRMPS